MYDLKRIVRITTPPLLLVPGVAFAQTLSTFLGLFNMFAGVMLVAALIAFFGGFIRYLIVLGNERRKQGLYLMYWGIMILFVLTILLGIINILQGPLSFLIGMAVVIFLCIVIVLSLSKTGAAKPPEDAH
ncbi:MAG TPA: hypothetical protein VMU13_01430 [Candidatus Paceibacterota bacterium]|nr:hypothetical protein [Candidatus Paceibacterota bacterium]